jgi:hypothetical protein
MSNIDYRHDCKTWADKMFKSKRFLKRTFQKATRRHNAVILSRGYGELALHIKTAPWW